MQINHVSCSSKSTDSDYYLTDFFTSKLNYTKGHIETIGSLQGNWSIANSSATELLENPGMALRRVANFAGVPPLINENNFFFDEDKGLCFHKLLKPKLSLYFDRLKIEKNE